MAIPPLPASIYLRFSPSSNLAYFSHIFQLDHWSIRTTISIRIIQCYPAVVIHYPNTTIHGHGTRWPSFLWVLWHEDPLLIVGPTLAGDAVPRRFSTPNFSTSVGCLKGYVGVPSSSLRHTLPHRWPSSAPIVIPYYHSHWFTHTTSTSNPAWGLNWFQDDSDLLCSSGITRFTSYSFFDIHLISQPTRHSSLLVRGHSTW